MLYRVQSTALGQSGIYVRILPGASVSVLDVNGAPATIYSDSAGLVQTANPITADAAGGFDFYVAFADYYDIVISYQGQIISDRIYPVSPEYIEAQVLAAETAAGTATTQAGTATMQAAVASDAAEDAEAAALRAEAASAGATLPTGETLQSQINPRFPARSDVVTAIAAGTLNYLPAGGKVSWVDSGNVVQVVKTIGATMIADMQGYIPAGTWSLRHWGVTTTGDQTTAVQAAFTNAVNRRLVGIPGNITVTDITIPAQGIEWQDNGAVFVRTTSGTTPVVTVQGDFTFNKLRVVSGGAATDLGVRINGSAVKGKKITVTGTAGNGAIGFHAEPVSTGLISDIDIDQIDTTGFHTSQYAVRVTLSKWDAQIRAYITGLYIRDSAYCEWTGLAQTADADGTGGPGNNGVLIESVNASGDCHDLRFSSFRVEDAGEHAFRIGGQLTVENIWHENCSAIRPGAAGAGATGGTGFKCLGATSVTGQYHRNIFYDDCLVEDASTTGTGVGNFTGFDISHVDGGRVNGIIRAKANTYSCWDGVSLTSSSNVNVDVIARDVRRHPVRIIVPKITTGDRGYTENIRLNGHFHSALVATVVKFGDDVFADKTGIYRNITGDFVAEGGIAALRAETLTSGGSYANINFKIKHISPNETGEGPPLQCNGGGFVVDFEGRWYEVDYGPDAALGSTFFDPTTDIRRDRRLVGGAATWVFQDRISVPYETRAEAVASLGDLTHVRDQTVIGWRSGNRTFQVRKSTGATDIADMSGWVPHGDVDPDHWGDNLTPGTTDMQAALVAAAAYCNTNELPLHGVGAYASTATIPYLWDIETVGDWTITQGGGTWYANPKGDSEINVIYVTTTGADAADGRTNSTGTTFPIAWARMKALGAKAADGRWRIQMEAGTHTAEGQVIANMPYFRRPLEVWGRAASLSSVPTTIWDGTGAATYAALRGGLSGSENGFANLDFQSIKFTNWSGNGIVYWYNGRINCRNLHSDGIDYPFDYRGIRLKQTGGVIANALNGIRSYYGCNSNIGGLGADEAITYNNCETGVGVSRGGIAYIEGGIFTGTSVQNVSVSHNARIRTQGNAFGGFTDRAVYVDNGIWDQPKPGSTADTYPTLTETAPAYLATGTAVIQGLAVLGQKFMHARSGRDGVNLFSISGTTSQILLSDALYGNSDWVPFRLPSFTLYSPTFELEVLFELNLAAGHQGGEIALHGEGSTSATKLATLTLAPVVSAKRGILRMSVVNDPGTTTASYEVHWPATGEYSGGNSTPTLNTTALRTNTASELLFRLYWTPTAGGAEVATFSNMRTFVIA